jgi:formylglycine-generating enzyme required for sulfatase activity
MLAIPAGRFRMGEGAPDYREVTPHEERVGAFCIDRTEVTAGAYARCTSEACQGVVQLGWCANAEEHAQHPRNCVTWEQAAAYCEWRGARLPTNAEWEYAARGTDGRLFPWGNEPPDSTRTRWNREFTEEERWSLMRSSPVGSYPAGASPFGVLDMAGNVSEWVGDSVETRRGTRYFVLGGDYMGSSPELFQVTDRILLDGDPSHTVGFRCAFTP